MRGFTPRQLRKLIAHASNGDRDLTRRVAFPVRFSNPRLYDDFTDFDDMKEHSGVYIIYCCERRSTPKTEQSRVLYIGRGWVGDRLLYHKLNKRGLEKFAREHTVKFTFCLLHDTDDEFVLEGILLLEHEYIFDRLPFFNDRPGSNTLYGWHDVVSMHPGPRHILNKYGT